ncbi:citrate synthase-lysine N-methyltransferase CSKMT, mitochondrial isoform X2 [Latimeria chalumnae]|nr:PREDICTED: methyltransferase-like protein 12, mitochondrial isoform X2 [Latimeria chalumnae]|eukprot:XP_014354264.1 PREDICTED: methyltransferase-like protein 12, mitochondrial isoform X2 [Latimeria chalumnae]
MDKKTTWDRFYTENNAEKFRHFDWFFNYKFASGFLLSYLGEKKGCGPFKILDLGCGTSDIGPGLYRDSTVPVQLFCVDFSQVAIRHMLQQLSAMPLPAAHPGSQIRFLEADATDLRGFQAQSFDLALDKGTSDALLRSKAGPGKAASMLLECLRVLAPRGSLLQFSDEDPDARIPFLELVTSTDPRGVDVTVQELGNVRGVCYFAYSVTVRPSPRSV